uniref:DUF659 domain-containing protein n=1 Tax=Cajanus cajan TaxID=3821 RepID=A0A151SGN3_CAJCA|nr:hypothetical protein KK1_000140 [Cajanus cajan]
MSSNPPQTQSQTFLNSVKRTDIGWKHCHPTKENDTNEIMCNYCDKKQRCIINFLVNSVVGTMFIKSVDGSNFVKIEEKLFELLDSIVEDIGEEKVVQVITDNGSNYVLAGKMLEAKRKKIFWTPCAAHCIDLMLEDIGKLPNIKGCERNWNFFEQIHTKRRNRLDHKKLHDLVYVQYNQTLMRRYNLKDEVDPISINDIDECNEWLVGEMDADDDDEVEALDERVFGVNDPLTWNQVYDVSGVGEPLMYTRCNKRKQPPSGEGPSSQKVLKKAKECLLQLGKEKEKWLKLFKKIQKILVRS